MSGKELMPSSALPLACRMQINSPSERAPRVCSLVSSWEEPIYCGWGGLRVAHTRLP